MALRNIVKIGDPILSKKSRKVEDFNEKLSTLIDDMKETMYQAQGVGLAAVQVGVLKRVIIIDVGDGFVELVNPEIVSVSKNRQCEVEGCLSLPGENYYTDRPMEVTVKGQDRNGKWQLFKGYGLKARAYCHEIDHLDGLTIKDVSVNKPEGKE